MRGMASLGGNKLIVFYYLSASEIWPDKRIFDKIIVFKKKKESDSIKF
jgi:hypothetical protein